MLVGCRDTPVAERRLVIALRSSTMLERMPAVSLRSSTMLERTLAASLRSSTMLERTPAVSLRSSTMLERRPAVSLRSSAALRGAVLHRADRANRSWRRRPATAPPEAQPSPAQASLGSALPILYNCRAGPLVKQMRSPTATTIPYKIHPAVGGRLVHTDLKHFAITGSATWESLGALPEVGYSKSPGDRRRQQVVAARHVVADVIRIDAVRLFVENGGRVDEVYSPFAQ